MNYTVQEPDQAVPADVATTVQNAGIAAASSRSAHPGEPGASGTHGGGSPIGALQGSAEADPEEAAAIVAAITEHLRAEARSADADADADVDDDAETTAGGLWTVSGRIDWPPQTSVGAADVHTDPWVSAGRMR